MQQQEQSGQWVSESELLSGTNAPPPSTGKWVAESDVKPAKPKKPDTLLDKGARLVSGFASGFGIPESVQQNPVEALTGMKLAITHPKLEAESLKQMYLGMTQAQQDLIDRAYGLQHSPGLKNKVAGFTAGIYSALPVVGPAVVDALDTWASGDKSTAVGKLAALAAQAAAPEAAERVGAKVSGDFMRPTLERALGGSQPKMAEKLASETEKLAKSQESVKVENTAELIKHGEAIKDANEADKQAGYNRTRTQQASDKATADFNAKQAAEHQQKVTEHQQAMDKLSSLKQRKAALEKEVLEGVQRETKADIPDSANAKGAALFDKVRAKTGDLTLEPGELASAALETVEGLHGVPGQIPEATAIMNQVGDEIAEGMQSNHERGSIEWPREQVRNTVRKLASGREQFEPKDTVPVTWDFLQRMKTSIENKMASGRGSMEGGLYHALDTLDDAVVDNMESLAEKAKATDLWKAAKDYWRDYKKTFFRQRAEEATSTVSKLRQAEYPGYASQAVTNELKGAESIDQLRKFNQELAAKAERLRSVNQEIDEAQKIVNKPPKPPTPKESPKQPFQKTVDRPVRPESKPIPTAQPEDFNVRAMREKAITNRLASLGEASRHILPVTIASLGTSVLGTFLMGKSLLEGAALGAAGSGLYAAGTALVGKLAEMPTVVKWIADTPERDIALYETLPPEVREIAKQNIVETAKATKTKISPQLQSALGLSAEAAGNANRKTTRELIDQGNQLVGR